MRWCTFYRCLGVWLVLSGRAVLSAALVQTGGVALHLPAPAGWLRCDGRQAAWDRRQSGLVPESNRLLAAFAGREEVRQLAHGERVDLRRSASVQVLRAAESWAISTEAFALLRKSVGEQLEPARKRLGVSLGSLESRTGGLLSQQTGERVQVKLGQAKPLGIFAETPDSLCWLLELGSVVSGSALEYPVESTAVVAACTLRVRERVLFLQVSSDAVEQTDRDWVQQELVAWRDEVLAANEEGANYVEPPEESLEDVPAQKEQAGPWWSELLAMRRTRVILAGLAAALLVGALRLLLHRRRG